MDEMIKGAVHRSIVNFFVTGLSGEVVQVPVIMGLRPTTKVREAIDDLQKWNIIESVEGGIAYRLLKSVDEAMSIIEENYNYN